MVLKRMQQKLCDFITKKYKTEIFYEYGTRNGYLNQQMSLRVSPRSHRGGPAKRSGCVILLDWRPDDGRLRYAGGKIQQFRRNRSRTGRRPWKWQ